MIIYTVQQGDTISSIAQKFNVTPQLILNTNFPPNPNNLVVGQDFVILIPQTTYTIEQGDTLLSIAQKFNKDTYSILRNNPSIAGRELYVGETIVIEYDDTQEGFIATNGYAYTSIDRTILTRTLPYLTFLTIFTYGFTDEGDLVYVNDDDLIRLANAYGAVPTMHLSTLTSQGNFSSELARLILNNDYARNRLIDNIIQNMDAKGYRALDIDFEYLPVTEKDKYIAFATELTNRLNAKGYTSLIALAPKTSTNQPGLLYESHDYYGLGNAVNLALLMTYEWGYTYGPPLAVAPIKNVENVIKYGLTQIPAQKILMGVPLYGYDWNLPYVKGTKATSLSPQRAIEIAAQYNVEIQFDEVAQTPYFYYSNNEGEHVIWFENARSVNSKMNIVSENNLAGVGYWNVDRYFPQNWLVLNSRFNIARL